MKHITIRQIKIFESVARNLSFSRAAEDLHLTQPAVSMQIKQMEGQAGLPLFQHHGKRITLTEGGSLILRHCRVILADLNAAEQSLADLMAGGIQRLRVGLITSGSHFFPHLIHSFMQGKTTIDLDMKVRSRDQLLTMLRDEQIDLAVMVHPPEFPNIAARPFGANPFVLVASASHPLALEHNIAYARIASECLIVREGGTDTRGVADETFRSQEASPRFMELGCAEAIKQSVIAGMGISLLAAQEVQSEVRAGLLKVLDVQGFPLKRHWNVVHRADRPLPPAARDFQQFLLTEAGAWLAHFTGIEGICRDRPLHDDDDLGGGMIGAGDVPYDLALRPPAPLRGQSLPDKR
ncbi:LysR substrate-binding domain-containing protein [Janthinobacterium agaricidamnosum]|uniref:Bacterial regulatory helix-turn-helix, lysR family protein n=1 Tax=Janthinobacterium agaricidamnosum NBRC 102515 = DSM 9628 TaxID=1349767 RepID=W0VBQ7_9BURK|nr:LysR substrate-binding domain-containing protein [Janthinobacterium agaricidamnosum]CDG85321.1 bacterial regulatory helix-turn-helix, lysR family protein [Janthinobacterium agaricidamnosum NBRC 102515 = DSM 9628]